MLALAFTMLSLGACGRAGGESQTARVDKLFAAWDSHDSPGCAVGISRDGAVVYEHGYGMANLELGVPITPSTVFAIASITKSFTAMSTLLAAGQGKLSLDDEVQKYIPDWRDRDDHVTVRHLLTHTSGIRDAFALLGWAPADPTADVNEAIVRILARQRGLNSAPGSEYQYNNGGYNLLATILKRATGRSLGQFADANIFTPLGMAHTHVQDDAAALVPGRASGYTRDARGWRTAKQDGGVVGNAGMYSTVGDLLRWEENFDHPRVGSQAMLDGMRKALVLPGGPAPDHGVGFALAEYRGLPEVMASGGDYGIATEVARFPTEHLSVAVLCNEDNIVMGGTARINPDVFINGIADIYLAGALKPVTAPAALPTAPAPTSVKLTDAELSEKTGLYRLRGEEFPVRMTILSGSLMGRSYFGDAFDLALTPTAANRFLLFNSVPFEFVPAAAGKPKAWRVGVGKDQRVWEQVTYAPPAADVRAFAGDYRSDELNATYAVEAKDSNLVVAHNVTVVPFEKDVFVGDWVGIMKFARDARGAVDSFTVNRAGAKGVRFDRITR